MLINRTHAKFFISKKRSVFAEWRKAILMQRAFMYSIKNVLEKGLFMKGFLTIRHASRIQKGHLHVKKVLEKHFLIRYYTSFTKQAFHIWKQEEFAGVTDELTEVRSNQMKRVNKFRDKVVNIKDMNTKNILHYINKKKRDKVFFAWK